MKITEVRVWLVEGTRCNWALLKICTDEGVTGVGESTHWPGSLLIEAATRHAGRRIIGLDPLNIDSIWSTLYRDMNWKGPFGISMGAIRGIDMALVDLKSKALGVPCYELLGGAFRREIDLYASCESGAGVATAESLAHQAGEAREAGFRGLRFNPFDLPLGRGEERGPAGSFLSPEIRDRALRVSREVREAAGREMILMIETGSPPKAESAGTRPARAERGPKAARSARAAWSAKADFAERLAELGITWYVEPAGPEEAGTWVAARRLLPAGISTCIGVRHYTRFGIRPLLERRLCDILMPDVTRCGGPSEMKRMASMAEAYDVRIAPHNSSGPLSTLASAHVCASVPNFFLQEIKLRDAAWRDRIIDRPLEIRGGRLALTDRPGLGVDLVEEELEVHPGVREPREGFVI
jgi:galactonate dehydratase